MLNQNEIWFQNFCSYNIVDEDLKTWILLVLGEHLYSKSMYQIHCIHEFMWELHL